MFEMVPTAISLDCNDSFGVLAYFKGELAAVLVQLSTDHADQYGHWHMEAGFGRFNQAAPIFLNLVQAERWLMQAALHLA